MDFRGFLFVEFLFVEMTTDLSRRLVRRLIVQ